MKTRHTTMVPGSETPILSRDRQGAVTKCRAGHNINRQAISLTTLLCFSYFTVFTLPGQDPDGGARRGRPIAAYRPPVPGVHGLVTAGHPLAAMAGLQILLKGGNA